MVLFDGDEADGEAAMPRPGHDRPGSDPRRQGSRPGSRGRFPRRSFGRQTAARLTIVSPSMSRSPDATPPRCLVTGATGYIGGRLVPHLRAQGHPVRVLARTPSKLDGVPWVDDVDVAEGDLADVDSLRRAFADMDVVYHLVHSMGGSDDFLKEEAASANNVVEAATDAGVGRIVYLSGLHPADPESWSTHLRSRVEVGRILLASGIPTVVLQAGVVIGSGSASFELIRHLTERLPVMTTPRWVHNRIQPIAIADALHYLVHAATVDLEDSRSFDIGGPDVLTYGEMMATYARVARLGRRHLVVLRPLTPTIASHWVGLVTPIPPGLARPLIESLECDAVMREHDVDDVIPAPDGGLTPYADAVRQAIDHGQQGRPELRWRDTDPLDAPGEPAPSDPDWSGELLVTDRRTTTTPRSPEDVLGAAARLDGTSTALAALSPQPTGPITTLATGAPRDDEATGRWHHVPDPRDDRIRLRADLRVPGELWLEVRARRIDGSTRAGQRLVFAPRGLGGILWWVALDPWRRLAHRILRRHLEAAADVDEVVPPTARLP